MTDTTSAGLVQQFVQRTGQLYSLPAVAMEVLRLTNEPRLDARALKDCLERDPALTTRVLKVVNSSLFGLSRPVSDLAQALSLLGTRPLKMLVLGFSLPKELFAGLSAAVLARYWRHTLIKAVAARELAEHAFDGIPGDEAFTAGLVQDIGLLALIQQLGEPYLRLVDHCQTHGGDLLDRELETLGFDHAVLSARLLGTWGMPAALCSAVAVPHDEQRIGQLDPRQRQLPQILHLADLLARLVARPFGSALHELLQAGNSYCGLSLESLKPIVATLQNKVADLAEVLALELPAGERYTDLLVVAHGRLADLTAGAAAELASRLPEEELLELTGQLRREVRGLGRAPRQAASEPQPIHSRVCQSQPEVAPRSRTAGTAPATLAPPAAEVGLSGRVSAAINRCRLARGPLSLALLSIDQYSDLLLTLGPGGAADLVHWLRLDLGQWAGQRTPAAVVGEATFALLWENTRRADAVETVRHALGQLAAWRMRGAPELQVSLSVGVATLALPPKNFPPQQLIDSAQRCLSGVQLSGGGTVKSIEF